MNAMIRLPLCVSFGYGVCPFYKQASLVFVGAAKSMTSKLLGIENIFIFSCVYCVYLLVRVTWWSCRGLSTCAFELCWLFCCLCILLYCFIYLFVYFYVVSYVNLYVYFLRSYASYKFTFAHL